MVKEFRQRCVPKDLAFDDLPSSHTMSTLVKCHDVRDQGREHVAMRQRTVSLRGQCQEKVRLLLLPGTTEFSPSKLQHLAASARGRHVKKPFESKVVESVELGWHTNLPAVEGSHLAINICLKGFDPNLRGCAFLLSQNVRLPHLPSVCFDALETEPVLSCSQKRKVCRGFRGKGGRNYKSFALSRKLLRFR